MTDLTAVLDADVLIAAGPRDTLLRAFEARLYQAYWSEDILTEVERNLGPLLVSHGHSDGVMKARNFVATLRRVFPQALVSGYQAHIPVMTNDPKDRHVAAAAVAAGARCIVTFNLRDYPATALRSHNLVALSPDEFLLDLYGLRPNEPVTILINQGAGLRHPRTLDETLVALRPQLPRFVAAVEAR